MILWFTHELVYYINICIYTLFGSILFSRLYGISCDIIIASHWWSLNSIIWYVTWYCNFNMCWSAILCYIFIRWDYLSITQVIIYWDIIAYHMPLWFLICLDVSWYSMSYYIWLYTPTCWLSFSWMLWHTRWYYNLSIYCYIEFYILRIILDYCILFDITLRIMDWNVMAY